MPLIVVMMTIHNWLGFIISVDFIIEVRAIVIFLYLVCFIARVIQGLLLFAFATFFIREINRAILVDVHINLTIETLFNFKLAELADLISVLIDFVAILAEAQVAIF